MCRVFEEARAEVVFKTIIDLYMNGEITKDVAMKRTQLSESGFDQKLKEIAHN